MASECPVGNITATTSEEWAANLRKFIPYISLGSLTVIGNVLIIVAIVKHKTLRSKYILTGALAGGDLWNGFGFLSAGVMRLVTVKWGTHEVSQLPQKVNYHRVLDFSAAPNGKNGQKKTKIWP